MLVRRTGKEEFRPFLPGPLPPAPDLELDVEMTDLLEAANRAIGRLDGLSMLLPDRSLFLYFYVRKEAVLSSQMRARSPRSPSCFCTRAERSLAFRSTACAKSLATLPRSTTGLPGCEAGFPSPFG